MTFDRNDRNDGRDNWDDAPQKDDAPADNGGNDYYKRYTPSTGGGYNAPYSSPEPSRDDDGATARLLGIIGLIAAVCSCQIGGIVLGAIAYLKAKKSARDLGYETSYAATGRVLGIVDIVLGALLIVFSISMLAFFIVTGLWDELIAEENAEAAAIYASFPIV